MINNSISNILTDDKNIFIRIIEQFYLATENDIKMLVKGSLCWSCSSDPIPTWIIKKCLDYLVLIIAVVINLSLLSGNMLNNFKGSTLIQLIKRAFLISKCSIISILSQIWHICPNIQKILLWEDCVVMLQVVVCMRLSNRPIGNITAPKQFALAFKMISL